MPNNKHRSPRRRNKWGDFAGTERVTATLGPKPRTWTWAQYHRTAAAAPWAIDDRRTLAAKRGTGPAILAVRKYFAPNRTLTASERDAVQLAYRLLRAGKIAPHEYRDYRARLDVGIVRSKRRPKVGA